MNQFGKGSLEEFDELLKQNVSRNTNRTKYK